MSGEHPSKKGQKLRVGLAPTFLCWLVWTGVRALVEVIEDGRIAGRRGPDVYVSENPVLFWLLSGFFALAIMLAAGLALICLSHWLSLFRDSDL